MYVFNHFLPDNLLRELVFFNTFEELNLPIKGPMEGAAVLQWSSCTNHPQPRVCTWLQPRGFSHGKHDSNDPSPVQQAQRFRFPHGLR